jgi:hypothetical protein
VVPFDSSKSSLKIDKAVFIDQIIHRSPLNICTALPRNGIIHRRGDAVFNKVFAVDMAMSLIYFTTFFSGDNSVTEAQ